MRYTVTFDWDGLEKARASDAGIAELDQKGREALIREHVELEALPFGRNGAKIVSVRELGQVAEVTKLPGVRR